MRHPMAQRSFFTIPRQRANIEITPPRSPKARRQQHIRRQQYRTVSHLPSWPGSRGTSLFSRWRRSARNTLVHRGHKLKVVAIQISQGCDPAAAHSCDAYQNPGSLVLTPLAMDATMHPQLGWCLDAEHSVDLVQCPGLRPPPLTRNANDG